MSMSTSAAPLLLLLGRMLLASCLVLRPMKQGETEGSDFPTIGWSWHAKESRGVLGEHPEQLLRPSEIGGKELQFPEMQVGEMSIHGRTVIYASDPPELLSFSSNFHDLEQVNIVQHGGWWTDMEALPTWGTVAPTSRVGYLAILFMTEELCANQTNDCKAGDCDKRCLREPSEMFPKGGACRKYLEKFSQCSRYHQWSTVSTMGPRHLWSTGGYSNDGANQSERAISSFDVMDHVLDRLSRRKRFPDLQRIEMVGQCSGASFIYLYSLVGKMLPKIKRLLDIRTLLSNPSYFPWAGSDRPFLNNCEDVTAWPYGTNASRMHYMRHMKIPAYPHVPTFIITGLEDNQWHKETCAKTAQGASRAERARFFAFHLAQAAGDAALRRVTFVEQDATHNYNHMLLEKHPFVFLLRDFTPGQKWTVFPDYMCGAPHKLVKELSATSWSECQAACNDTPKCKAAVLVNNTKCSTYEYCTFVQPREAYRSHVVNGVTATNGKPKELSQKCRRECSKDQEGDQPCVSYFVDINPDSGTAVCELSRRLPGTHELASMVGVEHDAMAMEEDQATRLAEEDAAKVIAEVEGAAAKLVEEEAAKEAAAEHAEEEARKEAAAEHAKEEAAKGIALAEGKTNAATASKQAAKPRRKPANKKVAKRRRLHRAPTAMSSSAPPAHALEAWAVGAHDARRQNRQRRKKASK